MVYVVKAQIEVSTKMVDKTATPADDARMTRLINDARKYYGPGGPGADKSEEFSNKLRAKLAAEVNNLAAEVKGQKK